MELDLNKPSEFLITAYEKRKEDNPKLTLYKYSELIGVHPSMLSRWMNGKAIPDTSSLANIIDRLGFAVVIKKK